jgi:hypothetical protein
MGGRCLGVDFCVVATGDDQNAGDRYCKCGYSLAHLCLPLQPSLVEGDSAPWPCRVSRENNGAVLRLTPVLSQAAFRGNDEPRF